MNTEVPVRSVLAKALRCHMDARGWSEADLAGRSRLSLPVVRACLDADREISFRELERLTRTLGVPVLRFLVRPGTRLWRVRRPRPHRPDSAYERWMRRRGYRSW